MVSSWKTFQLIGYKPKTTFWADFSIAERFGIKEIEDTAQRAFDEWKNNIEYLTELIMVINHKSWYWYDKKNKELSDCYSTLYFKFDSMALHHIDETMGKEELAYFLETLD